jgi:hypothetical protein
MTFQHCVRKGSKHQESQEQVWKEGDFNAKHAYFVKNIFLPSELETLNFEILCHKMH